MFLNGYGLAVFSLLLEWESLAFGRCTGELAEVCLTGYGTGGLMMSIRITTDAFEWTDRDPYGIPCKNKVSIDVATTITHDIVSIRAAIIPPDPTWDIWNLIELNLTHEEVSTLAAAIQKAVES